MAMGMLVVPTEKRSLNAVTASGKKYPKATPKRHGEEDPQGEIAVKEGKLTRNTGRWCGDGFLGTHLRRLHLSIHQPGGHFGFGRDAPGADHFFIDDEARAFPGWDTCGSRPNRSP